MSLCSDRLTLATLRQSLVADRVYRVDDFSFPALEKTHPKCGLLGTSLWTLDLYCEH